MPTLFRFTHSILLLAVMTLLFFPGTTLFSKAARADNYGGLTPLERLGKRVFFDTSLSEPAGQACSSCHVPETGFTGPSSARENPGAIEPGVVVGRFGNRKPPSVAYAAFSPEFHFDKKEKLYLGGQFWDGRASTLQDQAGQPFMNPLEMNVATPRAVCAKVNKTDYNAEFLTIFGSALTCAGSAKDDFDKITQALAAYEKSPEVNPFSSKYDFFLRGRAELSKQEKRGLELFNGEKKGNCAACHPSQPQGKNAPPLFTDFSYDNLGMPANPANPFLSQTSEFNPAGKSWKDYGLGAVVGDKKLNGAFKVSTLRNVAKVPNTGFERAYGHNGVFKTLKDVVHFYNSRDVRSAGWASPEFPETMNTEELGNLKLSDADEDDIVAFLKTLTDGYDPLSDKYPD